MAIYIKMYFFCETKQLSSLSSGFGEKNFILCNPFLNFCRSIGLAHMSKGFEACSRLIKRLTGLHSYCELVTRQKQTYTISRAIGCIVQYMCVPCLYHLTKWDCAHASDPFAQTNFRYCYGVCVCICSFPFIFISSMERSLWCCCILARIASIFFRLFSALWLTIPFYIRIQIERVMIAPCDASKRDNMTPFPLCVCSNSNSILNDFEAVTVRIQCVFILVWRRTLLVHAPYAHEIIKTKIHY